MNLSFGHIRKIKILEETLFGILAIISFIVSLFTRFLLLFVFSLILITESINR